MSEQVEREVESSPVQLARIEGKIDLIKYQGEVLSNDLTIVKTDVAKLKMDVHTLQLGAVSRDELARTVAVTLKDADAALIVKNEQKWTPLTRAVAITSLVLYITTMYFLFKK